MSLTDDEHINFYKLLMRFFISLVILVGGGWVAFGSNLDETSKKVAIGFLRSVIGYWIK